MLTIEQFKNAKKKSELILSPEFNSQLFREIENLADRKERKKLAGEIVDELISLKQDAFDEIIIKLSDLCFDLHGFLFIREGASSFLGDVLQALVEKKDENQFVSLCQANKGSSFPEQYVLNETLKRVFSLIHAVASWFDTKEKDGAKKKYKSSLAPNIANKVFLPLISNNEKIKVNDVMQLVTSLKNETEVSHYFSQRIDPAMGQTVVADYFAKKEASTTEKRTGPNAPEEKKTNSDGNNIEREEAEVELTCYQNAIESIGNSIENRRWHLGGFGIFEGGVTINFRGMEIRRPHRVAAIARLITNGSTTPPKKLYEEIQRKAQDALDNPRTGQKESSREFYKDVVENKYLADRIITVNDDVKPTFNCL